MVYCRVVHSMSLLSFFGCSDTLPLANMRDDCKYLKQSWSKFLQRVKYTESWHGGRAARLTRAAPNKSESRLTLGILRPLV